MEVLAVPKFTKIEPTWRAVPLKPKNTSTRLRVEVGRIWRCAFDWDRQGSSAGWHSKPPRQTLPIGVPGSWNEQFEDMRIRDWMGPVWYYQHFVLPDVPAGRRVTLYVGSATYRAKVWINGVEVGEHEGGYSPFEFDITDHLRKPPEPNLLAIRVDNDLTPETIPQGRVPAGYPLVWRPNNWPPVHYDFFPYGGIHRPVFINLVPENRILSVRCWPRVTGEREGAVCVEVGIVGQGSRVRARLVDAAGNVAAEATEAMGKVVELKVSPARLWSPEDPYLYELHVELLDDSGRVQDHYFLQTGIRQVEVRDDGLYLNGRKVFLRGFGRHEDIPVIGKGLSEPFAVKDVRLLKWMGANSFRTSHYPYSEEALELADREGLLVIDESPANTIIVELATPESHRLHGRLVEEMILRDFNHPSVIAWSLGNECRTHTQDAAEYFKPLVDLAHELDPTRPATMTVVPMEGEEERCAGFLDFVMLNYYPGWYIKGARLELVRDLIRNRLNEYHEKFGKPILLSEFGADAVAGMHRWPPEMWSEEYQAEIMRLVTDAVKDLPFLIGTHPWVMCDFKTCQDVTRVVFNHKGLFTRDRQPKLAAHVLRDIWRDGSAAG